MFDIAAVLVVGFMYGFGPCTVFCAPIITPIILSSAKSARDGLVQYFSFKAGKILVYTLLGLLMGYLGSSISYRLPPEFFGGFLILMGILILLKKMPKFCHLFSKTTSRHTMFISGIIIGFVPCPPLLATLAIATMSQSAIIGALIGFFFGLGGLLSPLLLISLFAGKWASMSKEFQNTNIFLSGVFLIIIGLVTLVTAPHFLLAP